MNHQSSGKQPRAQKRKLNKVIFFDIDGTLVGNGTNKQKAIKKRIFELKKDGLILGINTNRPWLETKNIYKNFSFNGPVICEDGSYYLLNSKARAIILSKADPNLRHKTVRLIKHNKKLANYKVIVGNNKKILLDKKINNLIFITSSRRCTASIYVRLFGIVNQKATRQVLSILKKELPNTRVEIVPRNGKIIISNSGVDKISTLAYLAKKHFKSNQVIMISNDENIKKNFSNISFCGIKDSSQTYKNKCSYISHKKGGHGLIDIINNYL